MGRLPRRQDNTRLKMIYSVEHASLLQPNERLQGQRQPFFFFFIFLCKRDKLFKLSFKMETGSYHLFKKLRKKLENSHETPTLTQKCLSY
jgi:hypothetical protein